MKKIGIPNKQQTTGIFSLEEILNDSLPLSSTDFDDIADQIKRLETEEKLKNFQSITTPPNKDQEATTAPESATNTNTNNRPTQDLNLEQIPRSLNRDIEQEKIEKTIEILNAKLKNFTSIK